MLETDDGQVVDIEVNNAAAYGYDVRRGLIGEKGVIAPSYTRLDAGLTQSIGYAADWHPRYGEAYRRQNRAFIDFVRTGRFPVGGSDAWGGYAAAVVTESGARALTEGLRGAVEMIDQPAFYTRNKDLAQ